jgi:hypothetical protein
MKMGAAAATHPVLRDFFAPRAMLERAYSEVVQTSNWGAVRQILRFRCAQPRHVHRHVQSLVSTGRIVAR